MDEHNTAVGGPELFKAMADFQATKPTAKMDGTNPHFRSRYATLASILEAVRPATEFGLSVVQLVDGDVVVTMLCHSSGQRVKASTRIIASKDSAHGYGSGITYAKRYALSAIFGIAADEDDDGNAAVESTRKAGHSQDFKDKKMNDMWPRLAAMGIQYEDLKAWRLFRGMPKPSEMSKPETNALLNALATPNHEIRKAFDTWRSNR